jgi:hypothetical protein
MSETMHGMEMWSTGPLMMLVMAVVMVVPLVNVILLYFLAFSKWPSLGSRNM